ncbi:MAG: HupE/UreJ family protein, partial [Thermoanaerobaculia bacterium]
DPDGLSGQPLGIRFPLYNIGLSTLLRVEFLSGDRYAHLLNPGEDSWQIPEASAGGFSHFLREGRRAAVDGVNHFFDDWVHVAFLLAVCLLGGARVGVRLATAFLLGQMGAVIFGALLGVGLEAPLAEMGVALAAVLLAREALRSPDSRKQLTVLAVCAGFAHGLGIQNLVLLGGQDANPSVLYLLLVALGIDTALLISVMVVSGASHLARSWSPPARFSTAAVYGTAGLAFALAISALINGPSLASTDPDGRLQFPSMLTSSGGRALPGSSRVASNTPNAAIQSFVAIEAFEVRHEILVRLKDVAESVGRSPGREVGIEDQSDVKERVRQLVLVGASLEIDGEVREPASQRVDFMSLDDQGTLPRPMPVPEPIETAWVGVTTVYLTSTTAQNLSLIWEFDELAKLMSAALEIPATVTDPESSISSVMTPKQPVLRWENELVEDPVPKVSAIAVEPTLLTVPVWSLAPLALALLFTVAGFRRRWPAFSLAFARVMLVIAVLLGPLGNVAMALPLSVGSAPSARQAKRILARVLPNIYRAFEFREESAAFDRLALSVTGDTLTEIYLDHRRVLEMEDRGGARARVVAIEILEVDSVQAAGDGSFTAQAAWTVGGTVTHFGHRHFRQNRYHARVTVVPDQDIWKIRLIEVLNEERLR